MFRDYEAALPYWETPEDNHRAVTLFLLRFARLLGVLTPSNPKESEDMKRLRKAAESFNMERLLKIRGITDDMLREVQRAVGESLEGYLGR